MSHAANIIHSATDINHRLGSLRSEHRELEQDLSKLQSDPLADDLQIKEKKRRKLQIKDDILKLESYLTGIDDS